MQKAFNLIVERLEEEKTTAYNTYTNYEMKVDLGRAFGVEKAIEIVKQVAEEYKSNDIEMFTKEQLANIEQMNVNTFERLIKLNRANEEVCEWVEKSVDSIKLVREPHRLRLFHIEEERQYCPYCGKKIKVIGG